MKYSSVRLLKRIFVWRKQYNQFNPDRSQDTRSPATKPLLDKAKTSRTDTGRLDNLVRELKDYDMNVDLQDPFVEPAEARREYDIDLVAEPKNGVYDGVVLAVAHEEFVVQGVATLQSFGRDKRVVFDMKSRFPQDESDLSL